MLLASVPASTSLKERFRGAGRKSLRFGSGSGVSERARTKSGLAGDFGLGERAGREVRGREMSALVGEEGGRDDEVAVSGMLAAERGDQAEERMLEMAESNVPAILSFTDKLLFSPFPLLLPPASTSRCGALKALFMVEEARKGVGRGREGGGRATASAGGPGDTD